MGQSKEMVEISIVVISLTVVLILSHFLLTSNVSHLRLLSMQKYDYNRISDSVISYFYSKPMGIERSLVQMLGDAINSGKDTIDYGDVNVNISKLTHEFFDEYYGKEHWHLSIPKAETAIIAIVSDTSGSMHKSANEIRNKIPQLADVISKMGYVKIIFYTLENCGVVNCEMFPKKEYFECKDIPYDCELKDEKCEDWGDGIACIAKKIKPNLIIALSDEMSRSTNQGFDNCCKTGNIPSWSKESVDNAKNSCLENGVMGFTIQPEFDCGDCSEKCEICVQKTTEQMIDFATSTGGEAYTLTEIDDAGDKLVEIVKSRVKIKSIEWGYDIPDSKDVRTFHMPIPLPGEAGKYINITLYEW